MGRVTTLGPKSFDVIGRVRGNTPYPHFQHSRAKTEDVGYVRCTEVEAIIALGPRARDGEDRRVEDRCGEAEQSRRLRPRGEVVDRLREEWLDGRRAFGEFNFCQTDLRVDRAPVAREVGVIALRQGVRVRDNARRHIYVDISRVLAVTA